MDAKININLKGQLSMIHLVNQQTTPDDLEQVAEDLAHARQQLMRVDFLLSETERDALDTMEHRLQVALDQQLRQGHIHSPRLRALLQATSQ
jgi:hypothetical protein